MTTGKIKSLYTDGACSGNPGPGGWGAVVCFADDNCHELGGKDPQTTNNRMEMQAAIAALEFFANSGQTEPVTLYTDSLYVKSGITKWIQSWKNKGWKTRAGKEVLNQDLWHLLDKLNSPQVNWEHVRSHSGNCYNDRCDEIARSFSHNLIPKLQQQKPIVVRRTDANGATRKIIIAKGGSYNERIDNNHIHNHVSNHVEGGREQGDYYEI
jgi:ribonuclease HI